MAQGVESSGTHLSATLFRACVCAHASGNSYLNQVLDFFAFAAEQLGSQEEV